MGNFKPVFTQKQEAMLVEYLLKLDAMFYGLDRTDLSILAYEFAEKNRINHPFKGGRAGEQWLQNFVRRNPQIRLRKPEATSIARAKAFNKTTVEHFFDNLNTVMKKYNFPKGMIYNVDETGIYLTIR